MMPAMLQQMQNPAVQGMMTNPESLSVKCQFILRAVYFQKKIFKILVQFLVRFPRNFTLRSGCAQPAYMKLWEI